MRTAVICGSALLFGCLVSFDAAAEPGDDVEYLRDGNGYGYIFPDDPLGAGVTDPNGVLIKVRSAVVRRTLIRPRTHFVPELLKSAEKI